MKLLLEGGITDIEIFEILLSNNHQGVRNKQHLHHNNLFHFYYQEEIHNYVKL